MPTRISLCAALALCLASGPAMAQDAPAPQQDQVQQQQQQQVPQQVPQQTPEQHLPDPGQQQPMPEPAPMQPDQPPPGQPGMPEQPMMPGQNGAEVPEDQSTPKGALKVLARALEDGDQEQIREVLHAENPAEERMKDATIEMAQAIAQLREAAVSQWGQDGARPLIGEAGMDEQAEQRLRQATETIENDTGVVAAPDAQTPPITLRKVDDKWRVPMQELHRGLDPDQIERPLQEIAMQSRVIREFSQEVEARQYESAEQAAQALRGRMMQAAMGGAMDQAGPAAEQQFPDFQDQQMPQQQPQQMPQQQQQQMPQQQPQQMPQQQQQQGEAEQPMDG